MHFVFSHELLPNSSFVMHRGGKDGLVGFRAFAQGVNKPAFEALFTLGRGEAL